MIYQGKKIDFPAIVKFDLNPLAVALEQKVQSANGALKAYYTDVLKKFNDNPWLRKPFEADKLKSNPNLLEDVAGVLFPEVLTSNEIKALSLPYSFTPFYQTARLEKMIADAGPGFNLDFMDINGQEMYIGACSAILAMYYHYPVPKGKTSIISIPNQTTGKSRSYRMTINADFMEIKPVPGTKEITNKDFLELIDNYENLDLWKKKFPLHSWEFSGCLLVSLTDVNVDTIIDQITNDLLNGDEESFQNLELHISDLLETKISMSFAGLQGTKLIKNDAKFSSVMLGELESTECSTVFCEHVNTELIENRRFVAIPNVKKFHEHSQSIFSENLVKSGLESYFASPLIYDGENLGFFELGSSKKGELNSTVALRLEDVIPLLSGAAYRLGQEQKNKIEAAIQEEYTTIHPSVKWKFEEEANLYVNSQSVNGDYVLKDLNFNDVYPLYGQLDIRSSSSIRNNAVKNDLLSQLQAAKKLTQLANKKQSLLVYDELEYVISEFIQKLKTDMVSSSEQEILKFLNTEFEPTLEHHTAKDSTLKKAFNKYKENLHPELHFIYNERKDFDESVNSINKTLARYIDNKQDEAQAMFPHYFERYKTDGLEFNIYIGESISPNKGFHISHVQNLRLWQLMVMVEMERMYKAEQKDKKTPLEVASLILAFSNSLSIQFRMDEKRFDVEGAYNARYEIIKKRIDKANIKGTKERITQAGKMVVVYSNDTDEVEYLRYFKFLQSKGYLEKEAPELLYLENLQGVSGLRALRIGVNYADGNLKSDVTIDEIMAQIEEG